MPASHPALLEELPYGPSGAELFSRLAGKPWAMLLDSGHPANTQGRFDILSYDPYATLMTRGALTEVRDHQGHRLSREDPFALLQISLGAPAPGLPGVPFCGGALGYFGYDLGRRLERIPKLAAADDGLPEMAVGIYDWALVVDHEERRCWLVGQGRDPRTKTRWPQLVAQFSNPPAPPRRDPCRAEGPIRSSLRYPEYRDAVSRIKRYIQAGDCYQVNLAQKFSVPVTGDPWTAYEHLRRINPAPYGAYVDIPGGQILCASPERFLRVRYGLVETRPIKGTCPRNANPAWDRLRAAKLRASEKNRAENLMIVDLLRNDLGKSCTPGSIHVAKLFQLESFANVHHLVSTIQGRLSPGNTPVRLLRGCFPGGSITGAPKIRAMQIIEELEPQRRGVYCGSIGYIGFDSAMDTNIAIRTLTVRAGQANFWSGGAIVFDSDPADEYRETLQKAAPAFLLFDQQPAFQAFANTAHGSFL